MVLNFQRARHLSFTLKIPNRQENIGTWLFLYVFKRFGQNTEAEIEKKNSVYAGLNEFKIVQLVFN